MPSPAHITNAIHVACLKLVLEQGIDLKEAAKTTGANINTMYSRVRYVKEGRSTYDGQVSAKPEASVSHMADARRHAKSQNGRLEKENDTLKSRCAMLYAEVETLWRALQMANAERFGCDHDHFDEDGDDTGA